MESTWEGESRSNGVKDPASAADQGMPLAAASLPRCSCASTQKGYPNGNADSAVDCADEAQPEASEALTRLCAEACKQRKGASGTATGLRAAIIAYEQALSRKVSATAAPRQRHLRQAPRTLRCLAEGTLSPSSIRRRCRPKQAREERFLLRLHDVLQRLDPLHRRAAIAQSLSQTQRRRLERWMVRQQHGERVADPSARKGRLNDADASDVMAPSHTKAGYICRNPGGCKEGYTAKVHLEHGLVVQSGRCGDLRAAAEALARLIAFRVHWRTSATLASQALIAEPRVSELPGSSDRRLYFHAQVAVQGLRFAAPLRADLAAATSDWRRLCAARGPQLLTRGSLKRGFTPAAAETQWERTREVWLALWRERGHSHAQLLNSLAAKEVVRRPVLGRVLKLWERSQAQASAELARLLAADEEEAQRGTKRLAAV